jgi:Tfp pilus assembly protein PilO
MKLSLKELSWPMQLALAVALGAAVLAAGEFAPAPFPLSGVRHQLEDARNRHQHLVEQLAGLKTFEKQHAELLSAIAASRVQLSLLQQALPQDQELDRFMFQLQQAALAAGVSIRRITARPVVPREDHYEMPFEVELDGPYYGVEQFFHQLSLVPRIITVGDLKIDGLHQPAKYPTVPGATVTGTLTVKTFFQGQPQKLAANSRAGKKGVARR